jgi:hypothetical protein
MKMRSVSIAMIVVIALLSLAATGNVAGTIPVQKSGPANPALKTSCNVGGTPVYTGFDPADGFLYVDTGPTLSSPNGSITILESPCNVVKTISSLPFTESGLCGAVYDPVTKEMLVGDEVGNPGQGVGYLLKGTALVRAIPLGGDGFHSPCALTYDPAIKSVLFSDTSDGIDTVELSNISGKLNIETHLDAFDRNSYTFDALVQDGYLFCANDDVNDQVKVFDSATLTEIGSFNFGSNYEPVSSIAWDPLNGSVVMGIYAAENASRAVAFLNVSSIANGQFSHSLLHARDIFDGGVLSVAYSPATHLIYLGPGEGDDIWMLNGAGTLSHIYLKGSHGFYSLVYDSDSKVLFAIGVSGLVSVIN